MKRTILLLVIGLLYLTTPGFSQSPHYYPFQLKVDQSNWIKRKVIIRSTLSIKWSVVNDTVKAEVNTASPFMWTGKHTFGLIKSKKIELDTIVQNGGDTTYILNEIRADSGIFLRNNLQIASGVDTQDLKLYSTPNSASFSRNATYTLEAINTARSAGLQILPGATSTEVVRSQLLLYAVTGDNKERFSMTANNDQGTIDWSTSGTGSLRPIVFAMNAAVPLVLRTDANVVVGDGKKLGIGTGQSTQDPAPSTDLHIKNTSADPELRIEGSLTGLPKLSFWRGPSSVVERAFIRPTPASGLRIDSDENIYLAPNNDSTVFVIIGSTSSTHGNVGIGTATPTAKLEVTGGSIVGNDSAFFGLTSGGVGIGTATPSVLLEVRKDQNSSTGITLKNLDVGGLAGTEFISQINDGSGALFYYPSAWPAVEFADRMSLVAGATSLGLSFVTQSATADIRAYTNSLERMRIGSDGRVGIGTTVPSEFVHIRKDGDISTNFRISNLAGVADANAIAKSFLDVTNGSKGFLAAFHTSNATTRWANRFVLESEIGDGLTIAAPLAGDDIRFFAGSTTERLRIASDGKVGIGLTPSFSLDVVDRARAESLQATAELMVPATGWASANHSHGTVNSGGEIDINNATTGTLQGGRGGTDQATANLGDLLYGAVSNGTEWSRRAIGAADEVLKVSGGVPVWGATPIKSNSTITLSATYTLTTTEAEVNNLKFEVPSAGDYYVTLQGDWYIEINSHTSVSGAFGVIRIRPWKWTSALGWVVQTNEGRQPIGFGHWDVAADTTGDTTGINFNSQLSWIFQGLATGDSIAIKGLYQPTGDRVISALIRQIVPWNVTKLSYIKL